MTVLYLCLITSLYSTIHIFFLYHSVTLYLTFLQLIPSVFYSFLTVSCRQEQVSEGELITPFIILSHLLFIFKDTRIYICLAMHIQARTRKGKRRASPEHESWVMRTVSHPPPAGSLPHQRNPPPTSARSGRSSQTTLILLASPFMSTSWRASTGSGQD